MNNVPPFSHTCRYMAPEMMLAQPYTKTVDLWSLEARARRQKRRELLGYDTPLEVWHNA